MKKLKSKFIVFEGIDGSGKSTQAKKLVEYLIGKKYSVLATREPGGYNMRDTNLDLVKIGASERRRGITFSCERALHLQYKIEPALSKGGVVVSDRYFYSTVAYQGVTLPMDELMDLNLKWAEVRIPEIVFYIDLPPEEALPRAKRRGETIKYEELDFQKKLYENYMKLLQTCPEIKRVDGSGSEEEVFERVLSILKSEFSL